MQNEDTQSMLLRRIAASQLYGWFPARVKASGHEIERHSDVHTALQYTLRVEMEEDIGCLNLTLGGVGRSTLDGFSLVVTEKLRRIGVREIPCIATSVRTPDVANRYMVHMTFLAHVTGRHTVVPWDRIEDSLMAIRLKVFSQSIVFSSPLDRGNRRALIRL